jgi:hypothetical protein
MVSNALKMDQQEVLKTLERLRQRFADDPEYKKIRRDLPKDWRI